MMIEKAPQDWTPAEWEEYASTVEDRAACLERARLRYVKEIRALRSDRAVTLAEIERLTAENTRLKGEAINMNMFVNSIMGDLKRSKMEHGLCKPIERNACTACAAQRALDEAVKMWPGPSIQLAPVSSQQEPSDG